MMKRNSLLSFLTLSLLLTSAVSFNSCKKNDTNLDGSIPTIETLVPLRADFTFVCPYCPLLLHDGDSHWHEFIPTPENSSGWQMVTDGVSEDCSCNIPGNPNYCPYYQEGRRHRHHVYYHLHGDDGGYHNHWHVGGGGTGE